MSIFRAFAVSGPSSNLAPLWRPLTASAALGAVLAAVALLARGGNDVGRMAAIEIILVLGAGLVGAAAVLALRRDEPQHGSACLACFAGLTAVTALSMSWSIAPDESLAEAARSFAYLALFAAAVAGARLAPRAAPSVACGILVAAVVVVVYALASRVWPASFGHTLGARLGEPYDYWNALGATAALAVLPAVWLGTREAGRPLTRALAPAALGLLILTVLLTQSRAALAAVVLALLVWLTLVPLRLRTLGVLAAPALAGVAVAAWALSKDAFTEPFQTLAAREAVAGDFGLLVLLMTSLLLGGGLVAQRVGSGHGMSLPIRRRFGIAALVAICALPLFALTAVAMSERSLSNRVDQLTDTAAAPPGAGRLGSVSSSRGAYWRQAGKIFKERPMLGTGAGTFGVARLPYRKDQGVSRHAHGFFAQTIADTGLLGLAIAILFLAAWLAAAARSTGFLDRHGGRRPGWSSERTALCALALCALAFGIQSTVDWTWFVPGPAAMALVAAGFVAGRGPLPAPGTAAASRTARRLGHRPGPERIVAALAVVVAAGLCAWAVWQPEASARANARALERLDADRLGQAARDADHAREVNPYSPEPLYAKAAVLAAAGRRTAAYHTLEQAVIEHPRDPETWLRLARYELGTLDLPERAIESARGALQLDPYSPQAVALTRRATAQLGAAGASAPQPQRRAGD